MSRRLCFLVPLMVRLMIAMTGMIGWLLAEPAMTGAVLAGGTCSVEMSESESLGGAGFVKRLSSTCTQQEREREVVEAAAILKAMAQGLSVELVGVIVRGDLSLDYLPVLHDSTPVAGRAGAGPGERRGQESVERVEQRRVRGSLTMKDSVLEGAVLHRSTRGMLLFEKPVDFRGTVFQKDVDLSRSVFQEEIRLSRATFKGETYFVQGAFVKGMECQETTFGPRTRFYRSTFRGTVDCAGALFDGMAELLEVTFEEKSVFERARFGSGTGFSGSRFWRDANFRDAIFSRDTYFTHCDFEGTTIFSGAQFLATADFSEAVFRQPDDLVKARFDVSPVVTGARRIAAPSSASASQSAVGSYVVTVVCLALAVVLVVYAWKL
ncbi:MAG: pentapeptide repeat-containing protein [Nitrospira sp.]|nr:pentapeptide repeat-containing protein [Nitrospira sp.]